MLLSPSQAAARANVSEATILRRMREGKLPVVQEGARRRVRAADVDKLYNAAPEPKTPLPRQQCRVIAIANLKGGVGKTTTTANLAAALAADGTPVLVVDCDQQGNLTGALGPVPSTLPQTLFHVLVDGVPMENVIISPVLGLPTLSLCPSNLNLSLADYKLSGEVGKELRLRKALARVKARYDYILLDCPPALGTLTLNALCAADEVIVPVDSGGFALDGVSALLDTIAGVQEYSNPTLPAPRALRNRVKKTNLAEAVQGELAQAFGDNLIKTIVRESVTVGEAQLARVPITVHRGNSPASRDYMELAKELRGEA